MTVVILLGVMFVLVRFGAGEWYRTPADDLGSAERAWVLKEAVDLLAELASWALVLVQTERVVEAVLRDREACVCAALRRRFARACSREFWGEFVRASALLEKNPVLAVRELPALRSDLEESLQAYDEVLGTLGAAGETVLVVKG